MASAATLSKLVNALDVTDFKFPDAPVVCGLRGPSAGNELVQSVFERKEVDKIIVNAAQRRVDLRWTEITTPPRWIYLPEKFEVFRYEARRMDNNYNKWFEGSRYRRRINILVPDDGVVIDVPSGEIAVIAFEQAFLVPESEIAILARKNIKKVQDDLSMESAIAAFIVLDLIEERIHGSSVTMDLQSVNKLMRKYEQFMDSITLSKRIEDLLDVSKLTALLMPTNWKTYDPSVWRRNGE